MSNDQSESSKLASAALIKNEAIEFVNDPRWQWVQSLQGSPTTLLTLPALSTKTLVNEKGINGYLYSIFVQLSDPNTEFISTLEAFGGPPVKIDFTFSILQEQGYTFGTAIRVLRYDEINGVFVGEYFPGATGGFGTPFRGSIKTQLINPNPFAVTYLFEIEYLKIIDTPGSPAPQTLSTQAPQGFPGRRR